MHRTKLSAALLSLLVTATAVAQANTTAMRRFTLPDHGQFVIPVPPDWKGQVSQPPNRLPPTITFTPGSGKLFQILMTMIWAATKDRAPQSRDQIRLHAAQAKLLRQSGGVRAAAGRIDRLVEGRGGAAKFDQPDAIRDA